MASEGQEAAPDAPSLCERFNLAVKALKRDVLALYYAVHDERTPLLAKILPWVVVAYAVSPIDLIPDFIPVIGLLDDLLLLPGMIWLAVHLIPSEVMADARVRAELEPMRLARNWPLAVAICVLWLASIEVGLFYGLAWGAETWSQPAALEYRPFVMGGLAALAVGLFAWWLPFAISKEKRKRKTAEAAAAAAVGDAEGGEEGGGWRLAEPLLPADVRMSWRE
ncbi:hypothetical protein FOA52_003746 [Chlamydomonas sp. UWO 241]|nr:hypothetical protein FOA52_003746 [Chlamydomonas sp. UWO 241]